MARRARKCSITGLVYLSFLKQYPHEDSYQNVLITLQNQSTSKESNSVSWNGLQAVFLSNFSNKSFLCLSFLKTYILEDVLSHVLMTP